MNKKILGRLRRSFRQLEKNGHLPKADQLVIASSKPGLTITSFAARADLAHHPGNRRTRAETSAN